ncbi:hypothetical protein [Paenibacillus polymyxa]|uniref:Uncharacterized protein n=1 Tax=Paenibacillus polymyxa TaxID=1406 RepID=A0AAP4EAF3_PAEPO|nr:hypothetical protein [Paenibacillus polymyxa]MDH2332492.1 hypothetical protein [Paenibacillus polymyxa]
MKKYWRFMRTLTADVHFYTAQLDCVPIAVFIDNELVGAGPIKELTPDSVKIGTERFMRKNCTFKYAE